MKLAMEQPEHKPNYLPCGCGLVWKGDTAEFVHTCPDCSRLLAAARANTAVVLTLEQRIEMLERVVFGRI